MTEKEMTEDEKRQKAELDLLVDDDNDADSPDLNALKRDARFAAIHAGNNDFAVDPTHKEYRKVTQGHNKISSNKRKRVK
mgnify:CR=1 FL=1